MTWQIVMAIPGWLALCWLVGQYAVNLWLDRRYRPGRRGWL